MSGIGYEVDHAERRTGIGASDSPAVLGVSKWATPLEIYLEKRGEAPTKPEEPYQTWGKILEAPILQQFVERTGRTLEIDGRLLRSAKHPFMFTHLDGSVPGKAVVNAKTARSPEGWGEDGSDQAPVEYVVQSHHEMIVAELRLAFIPVLIGGSDFRVIEVPYDEELGNMVIEADRDMWQRIQDGNPPPPRSLADVEALYAKAQKGKVVYADDGIAELVATLREYRTREDQVTILIEECERQIKYAMGEGDTLMYEGLVLATWKENNKVKRLDSKLLKVEAPDVYDAWAKESTQRRFIVKEK